MSEPRTRRVPAAVMALAGSLLFAAIVMGLGVWVVVPLLESGRPRRASNDRSTGGWLKTIASAQADFRGNDRDANREQDYWRADIAGLHALKPEGSDDALKLIELSLAAADAAPVADIRRYADRAPKAGYWVKALRHADEKPDAFDPNRFAATAYPADGSGHRWAYIISESNVVYRRRWTAASDTPAVHPADPLKEGWSKLD